MVIDRVKLEVLVMHAVNAAFVCGEYDTGACDEYRLLLGEALRARDDLLAYVLECACAK